jgi:DNA-binding NarL/FixJ family response regulator
MIRLLIVDSHAHYRHDLGQLCEVNGGFTVVAEAETGEQALSLAHQHQPVVVLMDAELSGLGSLEATRRLTDEVAQVRVILLTLFGSARLKGEGRQAGAWDVLPKDGEEITLFAAIRAADVSLHPASGSHSPSSEES